MSQKYPYMNTGDDFISSQDMYGDLYQRQSATYHPSVRSSSKEHNHSTPDPDVCLPGKALSFLHSCGLDPSDLAHLAELPEHLITIETLPKLLLEVKERKLSSASSAWPSTSQPVDDTVTHSWEGSSDTPPVEYPIARSAHPVYPLPPEQVQTWQDRWGNPRQRTTSANDTAGSSSSNVPDYSVFSSTGPYSETVVSPDSFGDSKPKPLLSLKLVPPACAPSRKEASDFTGRDPPTFPHVCCLCDISVQSRKEWHFHVNGSEHNKQQVELAKKYPQWDQCFESARRNERSKVFKVPARKEASDFHGTAPPVFPHLCSLCNITVFSEKEWSVHIASGQHANRQFDLLGRYPLWDGTVKSARRNDSDYPFTATRDGSTKQNTSDRKMSQEKDNSPSRIVSFTQLPAGDGISSELIAIAKRFGSVKQSLFLSNQGYVKMNSTTEATKLVEHYSANRLKLKGRIIKVCYSPGFNFISEPDVNDRSRTRSSHTHRSYSPSRHSSQRDYTSTGKTRSSEKTHSSPNRIRSSERTRSSSQKRRSSERTHSSPKRKHSPERIDSSPKRRHSSEKTPSSPKRRCSSEKTPPSPKRQRSSERSHSLRSHHVKDHEDSEQSKDSATTATPTCHSPRSTAEATKPSADAEEKENEENNNYVENMDSDSDLEGLEVIADDGEELVHGIDDCESVASDHEKLPSGPVDVPDVDIEEEEEKSGEDSLSVATSEALDSSMEGQQYEELEDQEIDEEEDHFLPSILENCVTLDEFTEASPSPSQESDDTKESLTIIEQSDESDLPKEESATNVTAEPNSPENQEDAAVQPQENQDAEEITDNHKEDFGKVIEVRNLPCAESYTDSDIMNIITRYGHIIRHVMFHSCKKGYVEMALASDAEKVAADSKNQDIALRGHVLKIKVSEKYCHLPEEGFNVDSEDEDEECEVSNSEQQSDALNGNTESSNESVNTDEPVGTEFVRPVVGYFCNLCNAIYASEEEAKDEHCRSPSHREKVKEHKETAGSVVNKK